MAAQTTQDERLNSEGLWAGAQSALLAPTTWLVGIVVVGLALRIWAAMHPVDTLLLKSLPDDAFYYFTIARNIADGHGVTFDQLAPTNGFHPLWMALISPVFALIEGDGAVNVSLLLAALADSLSALMLFRIVQRLTGRSDAALFATIGYFLNPIVWIFSVNGLETSVNMAAIALVVDRMTILSEKATLVPRDFLLLGLVVGLALLGRTDNIFLVIGVSATILLWRRLSFRVRAQGLVLTGIVSLLVTLPWFLWNLLTFGSILQVSGSALPFLERQLFLMERGTPFQSMATFWRGVEGLYDALRWSVTWAGFGRLVDHVEGSIVPLGLLVVLAILLLATDANRERAGGWLRRLGFLYFLVAMLIFYHGGVRWIFREWYTLPITWTTWLTIGIFFSLLLDRISHLSLLTHRTFKIAMSVWVATLLIQGYQLWSIGIYSFQAGLYNLVDHVDALPEGARVGISDSGYVGYAANRPIVNLDGVVNNQAADAFTQGRLLDYLVANDIGYVHSQPRYVNERFYGADFQPFLQPDGLFLKVLDEAGQQSYLRLPDSGRIDLGQAEGWKFVGSGWSRDEAPGEGIWADSLHASAFVALPTLNSEAPYLLRLHAMPFSHGVSETQHITLMVNGARVGEPLTMERELVLYEVALPRDVLREGVNKIEFSFQYKIAPSAVDYSADTRTLAVWVDYIELLPAN